MERFEFYSQELRDILCETLQGESKRIQKTFGPSEETEDIQITIEYIKTGVIPDDVMYEIENYAILYSAQNDFETLCRDYDLEPEDYESNDS